jgi:hypothetical protein
VRILSLFHYPSSRTERRAPEANVAPIRDLRRFDSPVEVPDSFGLRPQLPG